MACCPLCHGTGEVAVAIPADNLASTMAALRAACVAIGATITGDGRVGEDTAAMLIGRERKTLANWRHMHRPIPFLIRRRRVEYRLDDLAQWMRENDQQPDF